MHDNTNTQPPFMHRVHFKRFDTSLPLPAYKTSGAAGFDLVARETVVILPQTIGYVPLNIALALPEGYWVLLTARSSLHTKGVMLANGVGIGDYDYRGDGDEYKAALYNFTVEPVTIQRGDRIVQMVLMRQHQAELIEVEVLADTDRGGFGSTGQR